MSLLLGIYDGHNACVAAARDGRVIHALQEERRSREKNHYGPPEQATGAVLELAGATPEDVSGVYIASRYIPRPRRARDVKLAFDRNFHYDLKQRTGAFLGGIPAYRRLRARQRMAERVAVVDAWGLDPAKVRFVDHHEAHAATAYYGLRRDQEPYLVLTLDGGGDGLSGSVWTADPTGLRRLATIANHDSLGEIYAATTHMLGFMPLEHEYKLMGMAPYCDEAYGRQAAQVYERYLELDAAHLRFRRRVPEPLTRIGPRLQRDLERVRFDSICAGLQLFTERMLTRWVQACVERTGIRRVLAAGGVFMNVKANKSVSQLEMVDHFEAFPSCGDESLSFGACWLGAREAGEEPRSIDHVYLGDDLDERDCAAATAGAEDLEVERPDDMARRVARLLADGEIVARASGPMEFGARALGNRSILADPIHSDAVRVINRMIKKRDFWMPFAPVVRRAMADSYFVNPKGLPSPYMMNTFDTTARRTDMMAAVHGADLTARPQFVEAGQNPAYEAILENFADITGRHVLLNTSFNLHGEPIVGSAADAVRVLRESGLQRLILGPLLVSKRATR